MKSTIQKFQEKKLLQVSKKVMMLAILVLGTTAVVNAQTTPAKASVTKEVQMGKHKKSKIYTINKGVTKKGIKK